MIVLYLLNNKTMVNKEGQIQYSNRENVTPAMCVVFWKKERQLFLDGLDTKIKYDDKVDTGLYINQKIKECEALDKKLSIEIEE